MRVWTLHPKYLDAKGLVALWREALLAQKVLRGDTKGYRNHPQLIRFRSCPDPMAAIGSYLREVAATASERGYAFDETKITTDRVSETVQETSGQLLYEWHHLKRKLAHRSPEILKMIVGIRVPEPHPLFVIVPGEVRNWENA